MPACPNLHNKRGGAGNMEERATDSHLAPNEVVYFGVAVCWIVITDLQIRMLAFFAYREKLVCSAELSTTNKAIYAIVTRMDEIAEVNSLQWSVKFFKS